jgi:antitoxin (DNA-binding transcriptional repressor) of toxin-antitoxin stability system
MSTYTIYNAKTHLSSLIDQACSGEEVIIAKGKTPMVKLVSLAIANPQRQFGSMKGQAQVTDAFFDALPNDELDAWAQ